MFEAVLSRDHGWRVTFDKRDLFGAVNERVARETARLLQQSRTDHYRG